MTEPHAQPDAPRSEELRGFLLHEDLIVRESVAFYFFESWSLDDDLIPLVLEGCRRYGEEASFATLGFASRYPWSTGALLDAVQELERSHPPYLEDWVARAPLPLLHSHEELLRGVLTFPARASIEQRQGFAAMSTDNLWRKLVQVARRIDTTGADHEHRYELQGIEDAFAKRVSNEAILEKMRHLDRLAGHRLKLCVIELAGMMKLREATTLLVDRLRDQDDTLADGAADALSRTGGALPIRLIQERYPTESWDFRLYAISVLQAIKSPTSETTLRTLVELEDDPALRGRIFDALRFHFTEEAATLLRREIRDSTSWMLDDELKKALYVNATLLDRDDPEAEAWVHEDDSLVYESVLFHIPVMDLGSSAPDEY
jgi:hypothetical protein